MGKAIVLGIVTVVGLTVLGYACGWVGEGAQVAQEEFGPRELLRKYEWFKNMAASLDAQRAKIELMENDLKQTEADYGKDRSRWPRDVREDYSLQRRELYGLKATYNNLAAEYNAQMAKLNWRFTNAGELPPGADKPLPREYRAYVTE